MTDAYAFIAGNHLKSTVIGMVKEKRFNVQRTFKINTICNNCWEKDPHEEGKTYGMQIKMIQSEDDNKCFNAICKKCGNAIYIVLYYGDEW